TGDRMRDRIHSEIRQKEKLLLVLSAHSVKSEWVREEVERAFAEEMGRKVLIVFPIRIDNAVMATDAVWAEKIRIERHIGDFSEWEREPSYRIALDGLFSDLRRRDASS